MLVLTGRRLAQVIDGLYKEINDEEAAAKKK